MLNKGVLVIRANEAGTSTANILSRLGFKAYVHPITNINPVYCSNLEDEISKAKSIIFTSANAVAFTYSQLINVNTNKDIYFVGHKTQNLLHNIPALHLVKAFKTAIEMIVYILNCAPKNHKYLYIKGIPCSLDIREIMSKANYDINEVIVYNTIQNTGILADLIQTIREKHISFVLFYSSYSARIYMQTVSHISHTGVTAICISKRVANIVCSRLFDNVLIARKPNENSMLELL